MRAWLLACMTLGLLSVAHAQRSLDESAARNALEKVFSRDTYQRELPGATESRSTRRDGARGDTARGERQGRARPLSELDGMLGSAAPALRLLLWALVVLAVLFVLYRVWLDVRIRRVVSDLTTQKPQRGDTCVKPAAERPEDLAAHGRYAEAVARLLERTTIRMASSVSLDLRPSWTHRERLVRLERAGHDIPRAIFDLVHLSERGLYGEEELSREDWVGAQAHAALLWGASC